MMQVVIFVCLHQDAGMIASGSTFGPHLWRVIEILFCMLHALVYSDYPRDAVQPCYDPKDPKDPQGRTNIAANSQP